MEYGSQSLTPYQQVLSNAHQLLKQGQPVHARLLLSRAEARLKGQGKLALTRLQIDMRSQIFKFTPLCATLKSPVRLPETSLLLEAKKSLQEPPKALTSDTEPVDDSEEPEAVLEYAMKLYAEDKVLEAYRLIGSLPAVFAEKESLRALRRDYEEVQSVLARFQVDAAWHTEVRGSVAIHTLTRPGVPTATIKSEGELDVPAFQLLSLLYETDLYPTWVPFCKRAHTLAELSLVRKLVYEYFSLPLIADRELMLYGYGVNALSDQGLLVVVAQSVSGEEFRGVEIPVPQTGRVRAQVNFFGGVIRPLTRTRTHFQLISNFDPVLRRLPYGVLNWFSRKFAKKIFKMVAKQAAHFPNSEHERRAAANPPFYAYVRNSLEDFFVQKGM